MWLRLSDEATAAKVTHGRYDGAGKKRWRKGENQTFPELVTDGLPTPNAAPPSAPSPALPRAHTTPRAGDPAGPLTSLWTPRPPNGRGEP